MACGYVSGGPARGCAPRHAFSYDPIFLGHIVSPARLTNSGLSLTTPSSRIVKSAGCSPDHCKCSNGPVKITRRNPDRNALVEIESRCVAAGQLTVWHCQTKFYTACLGTRTRSSFTVFAHELARRSARFEAENGLYFFALTVPVEPTADLVPLGCNTDLVHRRRICPKPIGDDAARSPVFLHDPLEKLQRRGFVSL